MPVIATQRPGVYSSYENSKVTWSTGKGDSVGIVALSQAAQNVVYTITKLTDAITAFGIDSTMYNLCEIALQNGAAKILAVSAGDSTENYQSAFELLETQSGVGVVVCDSEDVTVHKLLENSVISSSENLRERIGIIACAQETAISTWASNFNCERLVLVAQNPIAEDKTVLSGCLITAALAGIIVKSTDPSVYFNGSVLEGITGLYQNLTEDDIDDYIGYGVTPFEKSIDNVEVIRVVSSRTTTDNVLDATYKEINNILIVDYVLSNIREVLKNFLLGTKNNITTRKAISTQTIIQLEEYVSLGYVNSYQTPRVSIDENDPSVCIVEIEFEISRGLNQIRIIANIKV